MDRKKRIRIYFSAGLILTGVMILLIPFLERKHHEEEIQTVVKEFKEDVTGEDEKDEEVQTATDSEPPTLTEEEKELLSKSDVLGVIEIPSIGVADPIYEGASDKSMNRGIAHLTETAEIGEAGNAVLCGHNGSRKGVFFTHLCEVELGDEVRILDKKGQLHIYWVESTEVVGPRENRIKDTDGTEKLTLFTCAERGSKRFVCVCIPVTDEEAGSTDASKGLTNKTSKYSRDNSRGKRGKYELHN